jgi:hypothetical protein
MASIPSKETFFIQCNRTNSLIDKDNPTQNSSWTTSLGTDFNLLPNDLIFVDSVSLDVLGAEDSDSTLSFTATNAIQNGVEMPYCDNMVLLECGFVLNHNGGKIGGSNSLGLPLKLPQGIQGIGSQNIEVNPGDYDSSGNDTRKYSTLGAGLFNADHNTTTISPAPTNGSLLYEVTEKEWSSTPANGPKDLRSMNVRQGFDNLPYVLLRNDFMGCQGLPYALADELCPPLAPQTAFVLLNVDDLNTITNVNELSVLLTNKLNKVNTVYGDSPQVREYLSNRSKETQKGDLTVPYILDDDDLTTTKAWSNIAAKFSSNCMKTIPANLQVGKDYIMYKDNNVTDITTPEYGDYFNYLHSGSNPARFPNYWNNILFGNRAVKNIWREVCGDKLKRLDVWRGGFFKPNTPQEVPRLFCRPHLLNTQLPFSQITINVDGVNVDVSGTKLLPYQALFTNVNYNEANFIAIKEAFKIGEGYNGSKSTWEDQKIDYTGWFWKSDVGMCDDFNSNPAAANIADRYVVLDNREVQTFPPAASGAFGTGRPHSRICPCLSCPGVGTDEKIARGLGTINIHTRYNPNWKTDTYVFPQEIACQLQLFEANLDLTLPEKYDLGCYPYTFTDDVGEKHTLCYFTCFELYDMSANILPSSAGFELNALQANIKLLNVSFADYFLGTSNATLDNYCVVPVNNDLLKRPYTPANPLPNKVCNGSNFISIGAANPQLVYTPQNKFAFENTNTNILMNAYGAEDQVGQQTALFRYWDVSGGLPNSNDVTYVGNPGYKQPNTGIQSEQSGIFAYKTWLLPPHWTPPPNINLASYWDNSTMTKTQENHAKIVDGLTEASEEFWSGCLLDKLGFSFNQFSPRYRDNVERFNPETYNNPNYPQESSNLPLKTDNIVGAETNPSLNVLFQLEPGAPGTGTTLFNLGSLNNLSTFVSTSTSLWTADKMPRLSSAGHFNLVSDIVPSTYYNGNGIQSNSLFNIQKSYTSGNFIYGSGSTGIPVTEKRSLSTIKIDIINPDTNKPCRLSPNSCVTFRVERNIEIPLGVKAPKKEDPMEQMVKVVNRQEKLIGKLVNSVRGVRGERVKDEEEEPEQRDTEEKRGEEPRKNKSNNDGGGDEEKRGE